MLQKYSISEILSISKDFIPHFSGTFEGTDDGDVEWPHRHSFYSLVWFTEGTGLYVIDFQEYEIKPQRIFLVNTTQIHNWDYSDNCKGYILMVDQTLGKELDVDCPFPYIDIEGKDKSLVEIVLQNLIKESDLNDNLSLSNIRISIQYVYALVRRIAKEKEISIHPHNSVIEQFRTLIFDYSIKLSIEEYAEKLNISTDELNTICKTSTGESAKQYLLDLKITEAKRLLLFSNQNINEIAFQLGFEDSSYFSRIFKKKTSFSPSDFLKKYRKQE